MISENEAWALVRTALEEKNAARRNEDKLALREGKVIEREFLFAFFFNSMRYFESGQFRDMLVGNGPIIVNRQSGEIKFCGTRKTPDVLVDEYDRRIREGKW
jgi:hypothetical protein